MSACATEGANGLPISCAPTRAYESSRPVAYSAMEWWVSRVEKMWQVAETLRGWLLGKKCTQRWENQRNLGSSYRQLRR